MLTLLYQDVDPYTEATNDKTLQSQMRELVCYIWDNYLQLYDPMPEIFLMGVGNAYLGVKMLLISRGKFFCPSLSFLPNPLLPPSLFISCYSLTLRPADVKSRVSGVVNFVNGDLRAVKSEVDPELSGWYKEHSLVYVANNHMCWANPEYARKVHKRRFGTVLRSSQDSLVMMMKEHQEDVQRWILERCEESGDTTDDDKIV